jgi:hypothetical protein
METSGLGMSVVYFALVGHFDPQTVHIHGWYKLIPARAIDPARVEKLLVEYPAEVAAHVELIDGYVKCLVVGSGFTCCEANEFAYRLAKEEGCLIVVNDRVIFPPEAVKAQRKVWDDVQKALEDWEKKHPSLKKIISGGRIGAERAALDSSISHGGWVPKGRLLAERNSDSKIYKMKEMATDSYSKCSEQNVIDSDGTLLVSHGKLTGSSDFIRKLAIKNKKPWLHIDLNQITKPSAVEKIYAFLKQYRIEVLNVSGPMRMEDWKIYCAVRTLIERAYDMQQYDRYRIADSLRQ